MAKPTIGKPEFRPDIEGLRGIAILLVVLFHAQSSWVKGGFVGVDVFYVVSGYLITRLLFEEAAHTRAISFTRFYARRARRLLPASVLTLLITIVAATFIYCPLEQAEFAATARATATYVSNLWFMRQAGDYFATETSRNPLLHTWSLAVEEQFYFGWPLIVAFFGRRIESPRRHVAAAVATVSVISFVSFLYLARINEPWAFYASPARAWEFGLGGLASLVPASCTQFPRLWARLATWVGLAVLLTAGVWFSPETISLPIAVFMPCIGTAVVLMSGGTDGYRNAVLCSRPLQLIGRLSYSWYLWHWPALVLAASFFDHVQLLGRLGCLLTALGISAFTHRFVENPIRFSAWLSHRPLLSLALAVALTVVGIGTATVWARRVERLPEYVTFAHAREDIPRLYRNGCHADLRETQVRECSFGNLSSSVQVVLFGDSKAAQWFPTLERIAHEQQWRLTTITHSACPASFLPTYDVKFRRPVDECMTWRLAAIARIVHIRPALVVVSESSEYDSNGGTQYQYSALRDALRRTLVALNSAGLRVSVLRDTPHAAFDVPLCLARLARHQVGLCSFSRAYALSPDVYRSERDAMQGLNRVALVDLADCICGAVRCNPTTEDGAIVYRDRNHLTASYAASLAIPLSARLVPLIAVYAGRTDLSSTRVRLSHSDRLLNGRIPRRCGMPWRCAAL